MHGDPSGPMDYIILHPLSPSARDKLTNVPRHRRSRHQFWRELHNDARLLDNLNPPTVDHNYKSHIPDTVNHNDIYNTWPIVAYVLFLIIRIFRKLGLYHANNYAENNKHAVILIKMLLILLLLLRCGGARGGGGAHDGALGGSHHCPCAKHPYLYLNYPGEGNTPIL